MMLCVSVSERERERGEEGGGEREVDSDVDITIVRERQRVLLRRREEGVLMPCFARDHSGMSIYDAVHECE